MMIYRANNVEDFPFYKPAWKPANLAALISELSEVIPLRVKAETRALRCFQNLPQLCS